MSIGIHYKLLNKIKEEWEEGYNNGKIGMLPAEGKFWDEFQIEFGPKKKNNAFKIFRQNKIKGEWLIIGSIPDERAVRPVMVIQNEAYEDDILESVGDSEFNRYSWVTTYCNLNEVRNEVARLRIFKQADVLIRLAIGISTTLKELKI